MAEGNREHKDRLFTFMYGSPENAKWTLSLYNAVNGTDYTDPSDIQFTTIETIMYMGMHNDVSFIIDNQMNLYEQQSTFNPNMPLRMLQYLGNLYEKHVTKTKQNKYGTHQVTLPAPRFVVFYNGSTEKPDETTLLLSDAFQPGVTSDVEVSVRMINVNPGRSKALLERCKTLNEYTWLVDEIRRHIKEGYDISHAIDAAIDDMPDDFEIKDFLKAHKAEVKGMLLTEYDEAATMELFKEEGRVEGLREGGLNMLRGLVADNIVSPEVAAARLGVSEEQFTRMCATQSKVYTTPSSPRL